MSGHRAVFLQHPAYSAMTSSGIHSKHKIEVSHTSADCSHTAPSATDGYNNIWLQSQPAGPHGDILIGVDEIQVHRTLSRGAAKCGTFVAFLAVSLLEAESGCCVWLQLNYWPIWEADFPKVTTLKMCCCFLIGQHG